MGELNFGNVWEAVGSMGTLGAAAVAAWAARQSRSSARESNAAAALLAEIERDRRHSELTPRFRVACEPWNPGMDTLRLRVMLLGPPGLDHLDSVTVRIQDDHFLRVEGTPLAGGPTKEQVREQIWGPYMFTPGTEPGEGRADRTGRVTECGILPVGEELPFALDPTMPPPWTAPRSQDSWQRERGSIIRLAIDARHDVHGSWTLPCEIDLASNDEAVTAHVPPA